MAANDKPRNPLGIRQFCEGPDSLIISVEKVASYLGLSVAELARATQTDLDVMQLRPSSVDVQRILKDVVRVLSLASEIFDRNDSAVQWLSDKISAFKHETALTIIGEGRTENVIRYLHSIGSGFVG